MAQSPEIATPTAETNNMPLEQPNSIDEAIALVVSGPSDAHAGILKTLSAQQLLAYTSDGLDPLTILNPVNHSLAYLYFITARCLEANSTNGMHLFELLNHFIQVFDPTPIQFAPARFALVGKALIHLTTVLNKPLLALQSFKVAIERSSTGSVLTALHPRFLQACISAKAYRFPLDLLNRDIDAIDTTRHELDIQCFLEYYYYGAIVYIANKQYRRALEFLLIAISAPTVKAVSMIQLLAYRKFILVSFIVEGKIGPLPKYTSAGIEKVSSYWSPHHISLVKAFQSTDLDLFQDIASKHSAYFESFQELGLLKQCFQSLRRKKIREMTKVYITVSLEDMANKMGPMCAKELEMILLDMICQNQLSASISVTDQQVKMVHFTDEEQVTQPNLEQQILTIAKLNERIAIMNRLEGLNRDFQAKYLTLSSNGGQLASTSYEDDFDIPLDEDENKI